MHEYTSEGADQLQGSKIIYVAKGDYINATFSGISLVPMAGDVAGKGLKYTIKIIENSSSAGKNAVGILRKIPVDQLTKFIKKIYSLPTDLLQRLFKDFIENPVLLEKVALNQKLVDSWKVISNSPHSTDLDFIKFFNDVDVVSARNIVANNSAMRSKLPNMSVEELTAIYHYTTDAYYDLNRALRGLDPMTDQFDAFNKALNKSMDKLPKYSQPTYRGTVLPESILKKYKNAFDNGTNVVEDAFISTSKDLDVAKSFADDVISGNKKKVFLEINGNNGVDIEDISAYGPSFNPSFSESEISFKSGSKFKVIGYSEEALSNGEKYIKIILEQ